MLARSTEVVYSAPCVGLNADVKFVLLGDFRQLPAVLDAPEHSIRDLAGVGEEVCPTSEAKARLRELYLSSPGGRTPRWSSATASAWP